MLLDFDARRNNTRERRERGGRRTPPPVVSRSVFFCARVGPVVYIVLCVLRDTRREKEGERDFCVVVGFKRIISLSCNRASIVVVVSGALSFLCSLSSAKKGRRRRRRKNARRAPTREDDLSFIADKKLSPPLCVQSLREEEERFNTNRIVESDLERGRKKRDGAQQQ